MKNKKLYFWLSPIHIKGHLNIINMESMLKFYCTVFISLLLVIPLIGCGGLCERDTDCPDTKICSGYESLFWDGRVCVYSDKDLVLASSINTGCNDVTQDFENPDTETEGELTQRCIDMDQDNFGGTGDCDRESPQFDCNDRRDDIYPGAEERCDNFDNNCNDLIDALDPDMIPRFCAKQTGVCEGSTMLCIQGEFRWCSDNEYNNHSDFYAPFEENNESLCDNLDNDCDGQIDEGFEKSCYSGPEHTLELGICRAGLQRCENGILTGCINEQTPEEETCGNTGEDNNCDDIIDNIPELGTVCTNEEPGSCQEGIFQCADDMLSCISGSVDFIESCNDRDDNCDGQIDNASYCDTTLSCGELHCCLLDDGIAHCWGRDDSGESSPPDRIFKSIAAGRDYTCGLLEEGTVECWGSIEGEPEGEFTQIDAGYYFACGLKPDNTVECWGENPPEHIYGNNLVVQLEVGVNSFCTLDQNGQTECTGSSFGSGERFRQLSIHSNALFSIDNICGINYDDYLICETDFSANYPTDEPFTQVALGNTFLCAIKKDNSMIECWGSNSHGVLNAPPSEFITISAGYSNICGLRQDGIVSCWGSNSYGQSEPEH